MRIDNDPKLDFDDVLIRPKRSEAPSRSAIILEREHRFLNSGATWKGIPIVASNMDSVGTMAMARALGPEMMACLHKYYSDAELIEFFNSNHDRTSAILPAARRKHARLQHRLVLTTDLMLPIIAFSIGGSLDIQLTSMADYDSATLFYQSDAV